MKNVQLPDILFFISFIAGVIGISGIDGYLIFNAGLPQSIALIVISEICGLIGIRENGKIRTREKSRRRPKQCRTNH